MSDRPSDDCAKYAMADPSGAIIACPEFEPMENLPPVGGPSSSSTRPAVAAAEVDTRGLIRIQAASATATAVAMPAIIHGTIDGRGGATAPIGVIALVVPNALRSPVIAGAASLEPSKAMRASPMSRR